ncbi:hypothetical protein KC573_04345, partial [candidate division WWE3 bacterium]|nr:hypothetical protein [candidate division WWE3 bacterium]
MIGYQVTDTSGPAKAVVGTVSGTSLSFGTEYQFESSQNTGLSLSTLNESTFAVTYRDWGDSNYGKIVIGQVSGTIISYGSESVFSTSTPGETSTIFLNGSSFLLAYRTGSTYSRVVTVSTTSYFYPSVTRDSNSKVWVGSTYNNESNNIVRVRQSSNANDITAWSTPEQLNTSTNSNKFATILPLTSGSMYLIWIDGTTIEGKKYNGTAWDGSPTSIATGSSGASTNISATSDSSGNIHLVYINSSGQVMYQEYTTSWQTAVTLDSNSGNEYPTISLNSSTGQLSVFWIRSDDIFYKLGGAPYTSGYWDASATTFESTGTNNWLSSSTQVDSVGNAFLGWTEGTANPFSIKFGGFISGRLTVTENTTAPYYKFGSKSAKIVASGTGANDFTTTIDPNSTANHTLSAYVYNGTSGVVGGTVDNTVAQLVWEGTAQSGTTYTDMG